MNGVVFFVSVVVVFVEMAAVADCDDDVDGPSCAFPPSSWWTSTLRE